MGKYTSDHKHQHLKIQEIYNCFSHFRNDNTTCNFEERHPSLCKIPYTIATQGKNKDKL